MSVLVSAHQLTKAFAARPLFSGLTFAIDSGERVGLIGPNGAGKSTLLRILSSQAEADRGTVSLQRGLRVGFLEQAPQFKEGATILSTILEGAAGDSRNSEDWENLGSAREQISKLGLDRFSPEELVGNLSGGWKKRVALARELMKNPDLLLLDEPTNHLDVQSILWLEKLLGGAPFATLTITHDRLFLQRVANRIIELDPRHPGGLLSVQGDYATYLEVREQLISAQERREIVLKNTLRRETEWLRRGAKARTTKQQARIHRAEELQAEAENVTARNQTRTARIDFQGAEKSPKKLIEARGIGKSYGDARIFRNLDLLLTPGTRVGLLGRNGCGKSTLIRVLLGVEEPTEGAVTRSDFLSVAYFDQRREALDPEKTVVKTLCPSGEYVDYRGTKIHIRSYLDRFLFTQAQMDMPVGRLSGGEQSRLLIAQLMLTPANVLVLDEPTNDLDMATLAVLEECLTEFTGALILVTHDRYFLDRVANRILAFPESGDGHELVSLADLDQWETWAAQGAQELKTVTIPATREASPAAAAPKRKKLSFKDQRELESMEAQIQQAEKRVSDLELAIARPENASKPALFTELVQAQAEVERLYNRWSELESRL